MEYPSRYDFFLTFKSLFNKNGEFVDYVLVKVSDSFKQITTIEPEKVIGEKISNILTDHKIIFGIQDLFYNLIPGTRRKFECRIGNNGRTYLVNIFSDDMDALMIVFTDITPLKKSVEKALQGVRYTHNLLDFDKAYRDSLTGLYNKGFFEEELARLNTKRQLPLSIVMGDLNGLKLINDAFGHEMGDRVLKKTAQLIKSSARQEDIVSRIGGDEFMILLPSTSEKTAYRVVQRIKQSFELNPLDVFPISISFGIATKKEETENIHHLIKKAEDRMYFLKLKEGKEAKLAMVNHLKQKLEGITFETKAHYERLKHISSIIGEKLQLSDREREELMLLCEFHDIGKIGIPEEILQKADTLNEEEWEDMKRHSEIGYNIIKESRETIAIDELILLHHEKWDGTGYPGLFKGEKIPKVVRVFSIVDAYDAMVTERPYKKPMSKRAALDEILSKSGTQFDPHIANLFVETMKEAKAV
jgi:diguanylate cyclase (GGDEF)-like protein